MKESLRKGRVVLFLIIVMAMSVVSCIAVITDKGQKAKNDFRNFRAEGLSLREAIPSAIKYIRKYYHKSYLVEDSIKFYLARQSEYLSGMVEQYNPDTSTLSIAFVGDIMWIRNSWDNFLDEDLRVYLQQFSMVFGNLETMIDTTAPVPSFLPDYARYNSDPRLIRSFRRDNGENIFTALSLANNHAFDLGASGLANTKKFLDSEGILSTGATASVRQTEEPNRPGMIEKMEIKGKRAGRGKTGESEKDGNGKDGGEEGYNEKNGGENGGGEKSGGEKSGGEKSGSEKSGSEKSGSEEYIVIERDGIRLGLYAATWGLNDPSALSNTEISINAINGIAPPGRNEIDLTNIYHVLGKMSEDTIDLKILFLHWGYEFELYPDQAIMETGRKLAEAGADMVIGSHPHIVQPFEIWNSTLCKPDSVAVQRKSLIVYSLGNFTTAMYTPLCRLGAVISANLRRDPISGKVEWALRDIEYIYNKPPGMPPGGRKTMLFDDYLNDLEMKHPRRASGIREETRPVTGY